MSHGCLCLHRSGSTKFFYPEHGHGCGSPGDTSLGCDLAAHYAYDTCWGLYQNCLVNNLAKRYTVKFFKDSVSIGKSAVITPPMNTCITGTCVQAGQTQVCTVIDPPVKRTASVTGSVTITASEDISDYRIQYACRTACDTPPGAD